MFSITSIFRASFALPAVPSPISLFTRNRGQLAPRQIKYIKRHKGRVPIPIGGSIRGTTLAFGDWGIRIKGNGHRLSAKQLTTAEDVIKRKIKPFKGAKVWLRCFPDIPVCIKVCALCCGLVWMFNAVQGNETRMGKGKGTFEYWATRLPTGRVIFEIGGVPIREELARESLCPYLFRDDVSMFPSITPGRVEIAMHYGVYQHKVTSKIGSPPFARSSRTVKHAAAGGCTHPDSASSVYIVIRESLTHSFIRRMRQLTTCLVSMSV